MLIPCLENGISIIGGGRMNDITIKSVDVDKLEKDDSFPSAYAFYISLDKEPDSTWRYLFDDSWRASLYPMKRPITVEGNKLRLVTADSDNLEEHVRFAKQLLEQTNQRYKEHQGRLSDEEKRKKAELEKIEKTKNDLRKKLKRVSI